MSVVLSLLRRGAPYAVIVAVMAALWFRGSYYAERAQVGEIQRKAAIAIGNANAALAREHAGVRIKADARAAVAALTKRQIYAQSEHRQQVISDAAMEEDGPLAPVLRDQLERLPNAPAGDASYRPAAAANPDRPVSADGGAVSSAAGRDATGCGAGA